MIMYNFVLLTTAGEAAGGALRGRLGVSTAGGAGGAAGGAS